jgi:hypothetical protein
MTPVPISDINQVVGHWEGMSKSVLDARDDTAVLLMIDDKTFEFVGRRMADRYIVGAGTLVLQDGKLEGTAARLSTTFTLYDREGKSVLIVEVTLKDGRRFYGELTPAQ